MARSIRAQLSLGVVLVLHASIGFTAPASATYSYDDLGRLRTGDYTGGTANGRKIDYQYDAAGNRTTMTSGLAPTLSIGAATSAVNEGGSLVFPVTRNGTSSTVVTVKCVPQGNTAISDGRGEPYADFATTAQTITFQPTDPTPSTKNCVIQTLADTFYEGTQTMSAVLQDASAGAVIDQANDAGSGTILDTNAAPTWSFQEGSATEGSAIALGITRSGKSELVNSVLYSTSNNGSASAADSDFNAIGSTQLTFAAVGPASQQQTFSISTINDGKFEENETIAVLWQVSGEPSQRTNNATINNDDAAPSISINNAPIVNEGGTVTFTVTNSGNTNTAYTHNISWVTTSSGSATAGTDYVHSSGTVTFASGQTSKPITVATLTDGVFDGGNETFYVDLSTSDPVGRRATITQSRGTATIADADNPIPGKPGGLLTSPANNQPNYQVLWNATTGAVSYYVLEEMLDSTNVWHVVATIPATSTLMQSFTNKQSADYFYKVKACSASNQCGEYSNVVMRLVCNGQCD